MHQEVGGEYGGVDGGALGVDERRHREYGREDEKPPPSSRKQPQEEVEDEGYLGEPEGHGNKEPEAQKRHVAFQGKHEDACEQAGRHLFG